jgi:hypothetical protein
MNLVSILPDLPGGDGSKLLLFALVIVALFVIMRIVSRRSESAQDFHSHEFGAAERHEQLSQSGIPTVHESMRFEKIELRKFYMREFDIVKGPPDPFEFVDELTAEVAHLENGAVSTWEFTIGTPSGFARLLENKGWESFFSPEIFVIRKYELEIVREMIVDHISEVLSQPQHTQAVPPKPPQA